MNQFSLSTLFETFLLPHIAAQIFFRANILYTDFSATATVFIACALCNVHFCGRQQPHGAFNCIHNVQCAWDVGRRCGSLNYSHERITGHMVPFQATKNRFQVWEKNREKNMFSEISMTKCQPNKIENRRISYHDHDHNHSPMFIYWPEWWPRRTSTEYRSEINYFHPRKREFNDLWLSRIAMSANARATACKMN